MKSWDKSKGWLIKMIDGPLDGTFIRTWELTGDPELEVAKLPKRRSITVIPDHRFPNTWAIDTRGEYVLTPTIDRRGALKLARAAGKAIPMHHYQWVECDE